MATARSLVIAGYYGFGNWGDEAALAALIYHLRKAMPYVRLIVLSNDPQQTAQLHATEAINRWNPFEIHRALVSAAGFLLGPGSLLQDVTSTRSLVYYLGLLRWAQGYNLPTYLIGQGIGPLRSQRSEQWTARTIQRARLVLVRDRLSYQWATAHRAHAMLGEDLALLMPLPDDPFFLRGRAGSLGLSLRPGLSATNIAVLRRVLRALSKKNFECIFLPFQADQDLAVLRELGLAMPIVEAHRPHDLLAAVRGVDMVLGMRLHSLVFALMSDLPLCALSYDPKIESFLHRVESLCGHRLPWWNAAEVLDEDAIVQEICETYAKRVELRERLQQARTTLQKAAQTSLERAIDTLTVDLA